LWLVAFVVEGLPLPVSARETLAELTLAPALVVTLLITFLFDSLNPWGLPEPASQYAPDWAVSLLVVLTVAFVFLGFMALAVLSESVGWRIAAGIPVALAGVTSATRAFSRPLYPDSGASPETWIGSVFVIAATYLVLDGAARRLPTWSRLYFASRVALGVVVLAGSWLVYLVWR
jgi:hypothetical protein